MPVSVSNESLDPSAWTAAERQALYDELGTFADVTRHSSDYAAMDDAELQTTLATITTEIESRPTATVVQRSWVTFGPHVVVT